ncbi:MAG: AAA family ATPase, partial [Ignavibacteria bacterium]|nr:AAA family ATPase [Ignavibacteria bacterium]
MKLHSLKIENFRAIKHLELDFTDNLSKPRAVTLLVGPNGSGKTSILDAIQVVVRSIENPYYPSLREGLEFTVQQLVYSDSRVIPSAKIEFEYSLEPDEIAACDEVAKEMNIKKNPTNLTSSSTVTWLFPPKNRNEKKIFSTHFSIKSATLGMRGFLYKAISQGKFSKLLLHKIGGVCYLDQRRSLMLTNKFSTEKEDNWLYSDVLSWLRDFYVKHPTWNPEKSGESYWSRIQRLFNKVCYP